MSPQVAPKSDKTFSFDTIAVLLAVMESHSVKLGSKHYQMMSALDGKRGYNSFQHEFREVKKRAAELAAQLKAGEEFVPVDKTRGHSAEFTALPGQTSKKRTRGAEDDGEAAGKKQPRKKAASPTPPRSVTPVDDEGLSGIGNIVPFELNEDPDFEAFT